MKVAVAYEPNRPLVLEDLPTPRIGPRDVLVRVAASGICHTDLTSINRAERTSPLVPGHEACGTVEAVGPDVRRVKAGDRVLASVSPACGACWWCVNGMSNHCERGASRLVPRFDLPDGRQAPALCGCGSFAEAMVVDEAVGGAHLEAGLAAAGGGVDGDDDGRAGDAGALDDRLSHAAAADDGDAGAGLDLGGVERGADAGHHAAAEQGELLVGQIGLHGDDVDPAGGDPVEQVRALTGGRGADHSFEAVGLPQLIVQAFDMARPEGTVTLIGMPPRMDATLTLPAMAAIFSGKRIQGSVAGGSQILRDFPRYIRLAETGRIDLSSMVSRRITLDQVNEGIELMERGEGVRTVIV